MSLSEVSGAHDDATTARDYPDTIGAGGSGLRKHAADNAATTPITITNEIDTAADTAPINIAAVPRDDRTVIAHSGGELPDQPDLLVAILWAWKASVDDPDPDPDPDHGRSISAWWGIAAEVAQSAALVKWLLGEHTPTGDRLCRGCGRPGDGSPAVLWPCSLAGVALVARQMRKDGDRGPR